MKFLMLVCVDPSVTVTEQDSSPDTWFDEMVQRGVHKEGHELVAPTAGSTVRVRDGAVSVTDGPFAETKEFLAGFDILECKDLDEAVEVASKHPVARFGAIEVRAYAEQ